MGTRKRVHEYIYVIFMVGFN